MNSEARKVVLISPISDNNLLESFVEKCLNRKVRLICVMGNGCEQLEDNIDELIVGDGSQSNRSITTTSHPDEALAEVTDFAEIWSEDKEFGVEIIKL